MRARPSSKYLGIDSSFASISLARHLLLGMPYAGKIRIPGDLIDGPVSRPIEIERAMTYDGAVDLVVGDLEGLPAERGAFDFSIALNAIDMLNDPTVLPALQRDLLKPEGTAIQSCPYIWHENVSRALKERIPSKVKDSASAVEWLYQQAGLSIVEKVDHLPWLFFKHFRQLEIYSVHLFRAQKRV